MAVELIKRGFEVGDLILLDSHKRDEKSRFSIADIRNIAEKTVSELERIQEVERIGTRQDFNLLVRKTTEYYIYYYNSINSSVISSNIHLIRSSHGADQLGSGRDDSWESSIAGLFKIYDGYGMHEGMISGTPAQKNAEIIHKILFE